MEGGEVKGARNAEAALRKASMVILARTMRMGLRWSFFNRGKRKELLGDGRRARVSNTDTQFGCFPKLFVKIFSEKDAKAVYVQMCM